MKVLLRSDYQWHEAKWNPTSKVISLIDSTNAIAKTTILSIKDDDRNKYVICSNCGAAVLNTPAAIKKHLELSKTSKTCLSCRHCRTTCTKELSTKYTQCPDGTYEINKKLNAKLYCGMSYYRQNDIDSDEARKYCLYAKCEQAKLCAYEDIFTKYPDVFDDILTADVLRKKQWQFISKDVTGQCTFKVPINFNLYAVVNKFGFIDYFYYAYRDNQYQFMYSPKYAKLIWKTYSDYSEQKPNSVISDTTIERLQKKVIELYKEADK